MTSALRRWLEEDHREIEALLARAIAADPFDAGAFEAMRARLLRHIGIEERVVLAAAREARGGEPIERAARLRVEHGAIASLLVPTPDSALARELRGLLDAHDAIEEGEGGAYEECERWIGERAEEVLARARAYPPVPPAKHFDGPGVVRTAREALDAARRARAASGRDDGAVRG